jgi:hypothetical protein
VRRHGNKERVRHTEREPTQRAIRTHDESELHHYGASELRSMNHTARGPWRVNHTARGPWRVSHTARGPW